MYQVLDVRDQKQGAGWVWDMHTTPPLLMQVELILINSHVQSLYQNIT